MDIKYAVANKGISKSNSKYAGLSNLNIFYFVIMEYV